jgi:hypothetical protein
MRESAPLLDFPVEVSTVHDVEVSDVNMRIDARLARCLFLVGTLTLVGCGKPQLEYAEVEGKITLNGKPLPNVEVVFMPVLQDTKEKTNPSSMSYTDEQGHYSLWCGQTDTAGAVVGTYRVIVNDIAAMPMAPLEFGDDPAANKKYKPGPLRVPTKYSTVSQTPFRDVNVTSGKLNLDFDVKTAGR